MPPSSKRRTTRRKDTELMGTSDIEMPDSSPTRPSTTKRRKLNGTAATNGRARPATSLPQTHRAITPPPNGDSESENEADNETTEQDVVDAIIAHLDVSRDPIAVMEEHSNAKAREGDRESVRAYAKIAGRDWTFYVTDTHVTIGRPRDDRPQIQSSPVAEGSPAVAGPDIDLGPSKFVSRLHAEIFFDSTVEPACWRLRVNGRNGVKVNNEIVKRAMSVPINCGDVIEIAGTQMMFITPDRKATVHPMFLEKAPRVIPEELPGWQGLPHGQESAPRRASLLGASRPPMDTVTAAVAQPNFKRETTPVSTQQTMPGSTKKSPLYERGLMLQTTEDIDYSKDSSKDLKPPFPYSQMIGQAILSSSEEKLTLNNIYNWIMEHYAYYRHLGPTSGWQNSIRHNLSLNKAFQKVPRRTDEPGKGMKWQIDPDQREEFLKKQGKKGGQSNPSSPAARDPNFRGPNGQNLGYDRSYEGSFHAIKGSPQVTSPGFNSFSVVPKEAYTPDRGTRPARRIQYDATDADEQSPLPRSRSTTLGKNNNWNLSEASTTAVNGTQSSSAAQGPTVAGSNVDSPILSSSYYDNDGAPTSSMITPAPRRQQPRLAPPSTAQIPSKFMPMSSPAQFWKFADLGSTPAKGPIVPDMSPLKEMRPSMRGRGADDDVVSSSPPPQIPGSGGLGEGSPCKRPASGLGSAASLPRVPGMGPMETNGLLGLKRETPATGPDAALGGSLIKEEESDLRSTVNGSSTSASAVNGRTSLGAGPTAQGLPGPILPPVVGARPGSVHGQRAGAPAGQPEEETGVTGGFDLAKGFQSIGTYHQQVNSAARASS